MQEERLRTYTTGNSIETHDDETNDETTSSDYTSRNEPLESEYEPAPEEQERRSTRNRKPPERFVYLTKKDVKIPEFSLEYIERNKSNASFVDLQVVTMP